MLVAKYNIYHIKSVSEPALNKDHGQVQWTLDCADC